MKTFGIGDKVWVLSQLTPGEGVPYKKGDCSLIQFEIRGNRVYGKATNKKRSKWIVTTEYVFVGGYPICADAEDVFYSIRKAKAYCKRRKLNIVKTHNFKEWQAIVEKIRRNDT